jgi:hypothetical protein
MSEQPPTADMPVNDPLDDEIVEVTDSFGAPDIQALVAFVLAVAAVFGFGVLNGTTYFQPFLIDEDSLKLRVLGVVLSAVFALAPVILGWRASAQVLETDPRWVAVAARAAVILGLTALILRLVLAIMTAAGDEPLALALGAL